MGAEQIPEGRRQMAAAFCSSRADSLFAGKTAAHATEDDGAPRRCAHRSVLD